MTEPSKRNVWIVGILAAVVLLCFWPVGQFEFISYDDNRYITANPIVQQGLTAEGWRYAWRSMDAGYWHPLTWLTHELDVQLFRLDAGLHHLTNLLIHLATTLLLWWTLFRYTSHAWASAWVAAVFAIHPMHVETVAWIAERKGVLSGLFFVATLLAYQRYTERPGIGRYLLVTAALAGALMSKPITVTTPAVLLLLDLWPLNRLRSSPRRCVLEKLPWLAMAIATGLTSIAAAKAMGTFSSTAAVPLLLRLQTMVVGYAWYAVKLLAPVDLSIFYPYPAAYPLAKVIAAVALLAAVTAIAVWQVRRRPAILVGWCLFLGVLFPISGIFVVGDAATADRYSYLPYLGLLIAIAWPALDVVKSRRVLIIAAVVSVAILASLTARHVWVWRDSLSIWAQALRSDPDNWTANLNYAVALSNSGGELEAGAYFKRAVEVEPRIPLLNANYARWLLDRGRTAEAEKYAAVAGAIDPQGADFLAIAGRLEATQGRPEVAAPLLAAAIRRKSIMLEPHLYLARCLVELGALGQAESELHAALVIEPRVAMAHQLLAQIAAARGQPAQANQRYATAVQCNPERVDVRLDYAAFLIRHGQLNEADQQLAAADSLKATPLEQAHCQMLKGRLLNRVGRQMEAAQFYLRSQDLLRQLAGPEAAYKLAISLNESGQTEGAVTAARQAFEAAKAADHRQILRQLAAAFPGPAASRPTSRP